MLERDIYSNMFKYLQDTNMTYTEHLMCATRYGVKMQIASLKCFIHGFIPCLYEDVVSSFVDDLHEELTKRGRINR